ncbi:MAG: hypothetical protein Q9M37_10105 [Desulfonauticus sp.]|nr:hypothetical protein [Desulfonauticus sp.]
MKQFTMLTKEDIKRVVKKPVDLEEKVKELNNSLSIALDINDNYQRDNKKLKDQVNVAEGETSIVKAIGMNSPEMKKAKAEIEKLKADLAREKEDRQYDNLVHKQELEDLKKWNPKLDGSPK